MNENSEKVINKIYANCLLDVVYKSNDLVSDENLYHYTNQKGLLGIISSNGFWSTNINYMNDLSELVYSQYIINESIKNIKISCKDNKFYELLNMAYNDILKVNIYSISFSENKDLLSQWRAYSEMGEGYSIGISKENLNFLTTNDNKLSILRKVVYNLDEQFFLVKKLLEDIYEYYKLLFRTNEDFQDTLLVKRFVENIVYCLVDIMTWIKHYSFEEEKEWRSILFYHNQVPNNIIEFRTGYKKIVPYINLSIASNYKGNLDINEIMIGPTLDKERTKNSISMLLNKYNYDKVQINNSCIPLCN